MFSHRVLRNRDKKHLLASSRSLTWTGGLGQYGYRDSLNPGGRARLFRGSIFVHPKLFSRQDRFVG
jgi:hypothetical protein